MKRIAGLLAILMLIAAACGNDDADDADDATPSDATAVVEPEEAAAVEPEEAAVEEPAEAAVEEPAEAAAEEPAEAAVVEPEEAAEEPAEAAVEEPEENLRDLSGVCPNPLILQDNWFPAPEQAYLFRLIGDAGVTDAENGRFRGPLADTGIDMEIRAGGPYLGGQPTTATMQLDSDLHLGNVETDSQFLAYDIVPTVAVWAPLDITPQILMWNPEEYSFSSFEEIGESDATVVHFGGTTFVQYMVQAGILREDQLDPSYNGTPARFVAENGAFAQQAFVTTAAWIYENILPEWSKPVDFLMVHESGFEIYGQQWVVRAEALDEMRPCLERLIPIFQQSAVEHWSGDPELGNATVLRVVEELNSFWTLYPELLAAAVERSVNLGLVGNGHDDIAGNYNEERMERMVALLREVFPEEAQSLGTATDLYTNEFIDPSIGF